MAKHTKKSTVVRDTPRKCRNTNNLRGKNRRESIPTASPVSLNADRAMVSVSIKRDDSTFFKSVPASWIR